MIRDRLCMFLGGVVSFVSAGALTYAGSRLLYVVDTLHQPPDGLRNDLNLAQLSSAGLAGGLCLMLCAMDLARRGRSITIPGKLGVAAAGAMVMLSSIVVYRAFDDVAHELAELREMGRLKSGYTDLAADIHAVVLEHRGMALGGFFVLLSSQIILGLSLWPLYWSPVAENEFTTSRKRTLWLGLASAVLFAGLIFFATLSGRYALQSSPPQGNPDLIEVARHVEWLLLWARAAFIALAFCGATIIVQGLRFRVQRHA